MYKNLTAEDIDYFRSILGEGMYFVDEENLLLYGHDYTGDNFFKPAIILKPGTSEQVSSILSYCNAHKIPVTPRGAGTSLSGGALPVHGGVVLSSERMNNILKIDKENFQVTVEAGVINQALQDELEKHNLFYPPDPASKGSCFLGGNIAHSSGGPRALKYGTTRDYVLNLEIVLPDGKIIWTGANTLKYSTGYNLTHLMIGSEGTLGFVTKIVFKVIPLPKHTLLMLASFPAAAQACETVADIFLAGITPSALEFMERDAILYTLQHTDATMDVPESMEAQLLIELDGNNMEMLFEQAEMVNQVLEQHGCTEVLFAESDFEKENLWKVRRKIGEAVKSHSIYKEEDAVVPRVSLPELLQGVKDIGEKYGFKSVCYGHAGDGNLHINILKDGLSDEFWNNELNNGIREIFVLCKKLGGTISGEHGIGYVQKEFLEIVFEEAHFKLMRGIKEVFDPNNIMNPGKILPDIK